MLLFLQVVYIFSSLTQLAPGLGDLPQAERRIIVIKTEQTQKLTLKILFKVVNLSEINCELVQSFTAVIISLR